MPDKASQPWPFWFLGPKSEHSAMWAGLLEHVFRDYAYWRRNYWPTDPAVTSRRGWKEYEEWVNTLSDELDVLLSDLKADFPFFHPRYLAHMTSEQTLPAVLGYFAGMLYNPNNVTVEAAPVTIDLELEAADMVAEMLGFDPDRSWGHITSGGTIATLEALWVARHVQFVPFGLQQLCRDRCEDFEVAAPAFDRPRPLVDLGPYELLALPPSVAVELPALVRERLERDVPQDAGELVTAALRANPARRGAHAVADCTQGRRPVVFASEAAHYSLRKACNVLGLGEESAVLRLMPLTADMSLDLGELGKRLGAVLDDPERHYVAAVVATVGTTEFGAVDNLEGVLALRRELERERGVSFWVHVDAAWGGYLASMLRNRDETRPLPENTAALRLALTAIGGADSVTVDPHKLGYVPYPAGIVVFGHQRAPALVEEEATYISESIGPATAASSEPSLDPIGPFALEGSKPGAAAAACWLAHKTIPLDAKHHGVIVESTLRAARDLAHKIDEAPELILVTAPDTNIVCYLARPEDDPVEGSRLDAVNRVNDRIYRRLGRPSQPRDNGRGQVPLATPHAHPYFISRTVLGPRSYSWESVKDLLGHLQVSEAEFANHGKGLVVLRSTVMNPHYGSGYAYLTEFVEELRAAAR
jgi:glutamate/tyrosine decarboxylase-like PLP-dependent enzyme